MLTVKQVATRLQVSYTTAWNLCRSGELAHRRIGLGRGCIRIAETDLAEYLERKRVGGRRKPPPAPKPQPLKLTHLELS